MTKEDLKARCEDLAAENADLEAVMRSLSHDLRSPLSNVISLSTILSRSCSTKLDEDEREELALVIHNGQRMHELIDDMLSVSEAKTKPLEPARLDLSLIAASVVSRLRELDPESEAEVTIQEGLVAFADERLMSIALAHMLNNAWKFSSKVDRPCIRFYASEEASGPVFSIEDNGAGFDAAGAKDLFKPFKRFHPKADFPGNGLGLSIVKRVIARHGGEVWIRSQAEGGTCLSFALPPRV